MIKHSQVIKECTKIYNKKSKCYNGAVAAKVIREYWNIVGKTILTGQEFKLPANHGVAYITKRKAIHTDNISTASPKIGFDYDIVLDSPYLERFDYEFKASKKLRNKLHKLIRKGKDYIQYGN